MKAPHSNKASVPLCIQKQLCKDIEAEGGIAALLQSKRGALTATILNRRPNLYGTTETTQRTKVLSKINDWKRLFKQGLYDNVKESFLCEELPDGFEDELADVDPPTPPSTPPPKSGHKSGNQSGHKQQPKKTPKSSTPARKVLFEDITNDPDMGAREMVAKKSLGALKEMIDKAETFEVDCDAPSILFPLVVTTFTKIPQGDQLVSGLRMKMDVDPGEWFQGSYKMYLVEPTKILFKFPGINRDLIQWDQAEYDQARREENVFDVAMENQDSVQRQQLARQDNAGVRYFLLTFDRAIDNDVFREDSGRHFVSELDKLEINVQLTVFHTAKPVPLAGGFFNNEKQIWRAGWIVAFENERIGRPSSPITAEMAEARRWMRHINGQFTQQPDPAPRSHNV